MKKYWKTFASVCVTSIALTACQKEAPKEPTQSQTPAPAANILPPTPAPTPVPPPQPRHNYALNQNGTYGYEPALSEDDIRQGRATKALVMVRYVGLREGNYVLLIIDQNNPAIATRITCQAPCEFAQSQVMSNDYVLKTETVRVTPSSLLSAMIDDAMAGQLVAYGSRQNSPAASIATNNTGSASSGSMQGQPDTPVDAGGQLQQASFDCTKAKSIPEYLICHDPQLAASDRELASIFQQAKLAVQDQAAFTERTRKQWNYREKNCRDKDCLIAWYEYQKNTLTKIAQTGDVSAQ
ncbi:putative lipoprotein [Pandoraea commovens]|uniref:Putative lipoprotein n=1 Tax=Pandoraea commovens TaxID=2508289 RepID=A0A5E4VSQ5_9BURK|nr:hypothetical protein [Pandoraea commovens]VVE14559.1 putative lipoprotein [Pandoraea commovens]